MIQRLAHHYRFPIAYVFFLLFVITLAPNVYARNGISGKRMKFFTASSSPAKSPGASFFQPGMLVPAGPASARSERLPFAEAEKVSVSISASDDIGGPSQPEMASFKSIGNGNMVDLFTGDFSYNIPLLDVGGYPVNIFYNGNVGMEDEASWVGLGWNINPGTISRNMRGIPDDFNGTEQLTQTQAMKPNKTWGATISANLELKGKGFKPGASLSLAFNNYLGPSMDIGITGSGQFTLAKYGKSEKHSVNLGTSLGVNIGSRSGLTFSPGLSVTTNHKVKEAQITNGFSLNTSINSRTGIKSLQIREQTSFNEKQGETKDGKMQGTYSRSTSIWGNSISFARPSYIPTLRLPLTNSSGAGNFQVGFGLQTVFVSLRGEVFSRKSSIEEEDKVQTKPMVGYLYYEKAKSNQNAVMDFSRVNDGAVLPATPNISAPQYTYDVFSIQGEGTGGSIRFYRDDMGYVRDNKTTTKDKSFAAGGDIGIPGHFGININSVSTPSTIGDWGSGNKLRTSLSFNSPDGLKENVYLRNPGETSVLDDDRYNKIGGDSLVRFRLGGTKSNPTVEPVLEKFVNGDYINPSGSVSISSVAQPAGRNKRTQVTSFLTASEATVAGLDKMIRSYNQEELYSSTGLLQYDSMPRIDAHRLSHHISQINVTEGSGMRYVYGIPVYNILQRDFTFTIPDISLQKAGENDTVRLFNTQLMTKESPELSSSAKNDGSVQVTETPAYAHSFLLSGLLSPDYVDVTGDGISDDDLGTSVKFNYSRLRSGEEWAVHKWRTPLSANQDANLNAGSLTNPKDDKGIISYGEREAWYLHSIESKSMVAIFRLGARDDGKGANSELGGVNSSDQSVKKLDRIDLYNKSDIKKNGIEGAKPVKSVHFKYHYTLCEGSPDNPTGGGKLTLDTIYFTFNGKDKTNKSKYVFAYNDGETGNPNYELNASDRWGSYKPKAMNPDGMRNTDYPYSIQDKSKKATIDANAGAWALKKILLPSGGQIEVAYEADDYAFVQDRRAAQMMNLAGFGKDASAYSSGLYEVAGSNVRERDYVFINVPQSCSSRTEVFESYLRGLDQLLIKAAVQMPKGVEYVTAYGMIQDYGVYSGNDKIIWVKVARVDGKSPYSLAAVDYLREHLPAQAYPSYDLSDESGLGQLVGLFTGVWSSLTTLLKNPLEKMREDLKAKDVVINRSFARLNNPTGFKFGGGRRVKAIKIRDNWREMTTTQDSSVYGQTFEYTTTEVFNGVARTISSGVASYEPGIGSEENPFRSIKLISDKLPVGPATYGAIEEPFMESFFPVSNVGYSKVTVRSLRKGSIDTTRKARSPIGKQVTEYYTAKDFPVTYAATQLTPESDKTSHYQSLGGFFFQSIYDSRAISQGYLVTTNDMHGKMKSQASYPANDTITAINYTENFYRNTGKKGMNDKFDFVHGLKGGEIKSGNIGVDIELMTDVREFAVRGSSVDFQGQVDLNLVILPVWIPFPWDVLSESEDIYRAVTTTKVVNYHAVLDSVLVVDKGSRVTTKNLLFDAETGEVVVNRTNNEFEKPVYSTSYPAYWAYSGMGLAYQNIDAVFSGVTFSDGRITSGWVDQSLFESGDELLIQSSEEPEAGCDAARSHEPATIVWAFNTNKDKSSLYGAPDFIFIDEKGVPFTRHNVMFRIVRSGKRNMLSAPLASVTSLSAPVADDKLIINTSSKVLAAGSVEYAEKWQTDFDVIPRYRRFFNNSICDWDESILKGGYPETKLNPYRRGLLGNFRQFRSFVLYTSRNDSSVAVATRVSKDGTVRDFKLFWDFNEDGHLEQDWSNPSWVWNAKTNKYNARGMELETVDAMGIYTSAQYGYERNLVIAITNNARQSESFVENFEDYDILTGKLDLTSMKYRHAEFLPFTSFKLVNTDTMNFQAHTGRVALEVEESAFMNIQIVPNLDSFHFKAGEKENINSVVKGPLGGLVTAMDTTNVYFDGGGYFTQDAGILGGIQYDIMPSMPHATPISNKRVYSYAMTTKQYFEVEKSGVYTFMFGAYNNAAIGGTNPQFPKFTNIKVEDSQGNFYTGTDFGTTTTASTSSNVKTFCLSKGVYILHVTLNANRDYECPTSYSEYYCLEGFDNNHLLMTDRFLVEAGDSDPETGPITFFKSYSTTTACDFTKPIPASDSMVNERFSIVPGKKMLFSAWVREEGGSAAPLSYNDNKAVLEFTGASSSVEFRPSGPIVDGWQRYETSFVVPEGTTSILLSLQNLDPEKKSYFDDIRIHPFDANMKSYVYDPVNLRLMAELDANNYASFYEYDEEGTLIRTKVETTKGIKTVTESRSAKQRDINVIQ